MEEKVRKKQKTFFETRIRIEEQSILSEVVASILTQGKKSKAIEKNRKTDFRNLNQNPRQSKLSMIVAPTLTSRFKNAKNIEKGF